VNDYNNGGYDKALPLPESLIIFNSLNTDVLSGGMAYLILNFF